MHKTLEGVIGVGTFHVNLQKRVACVVPGAGFEPATSGIGRLAPFVSRFLIWFVSLARL